MPIFQQSLDFNHDAQAWFLIDLSTYFSGSVRIFWLEIFVPSFKALVTTQRLISDAKIVIKVGE